jgi:hypothetical protein
MEIPWGDIADEAAGVLAGASVMVVIQVIRAARAARRASEAQAAAIEAYESTKEPTTCMVTSCHRRTADLEDVSS